MVVNRKAEHKPKEVAQVHSEEEIQKIIQKGAEIQKEAPSADEEVKFTLRIQRSMLDKIDVARGKKSGFISRNSWLLDLIEKHFSEG